MTSRTLWLTTLGTTALALAVTTAIQPRFASTQARGAITTLEAQAPGDDGPGAGMGPADRGRRDAGPGDARPGEMGPGDMGPGGHGGPGDHQRGGRGGPDGDGPPPMNDDEGPRRGPPGGPNGGGPIGGGPNGGFRQPTADTQGRYMDLVVRYGELSKDPSLTGVSAVITANELLRPQGAKAGIDYFKRLLPDVTDATVQRAIRLMLIDLYRRDGQNQAALGELETLIRGQPTTAPSQP